MKVKVKDLKPNPYRNMNKYPVDRDKVEALKASIKETEFWDNLLARENGSGYQIAYGHHRLIALQELGIKEIDIPVKDIDDGMMIRIMANENMDHWKSNPSVTLETIRAARDFLNSELAKYESWQEAPSGLINLLDLNNRGVFQNIKTKGVGKPTILKFLGKSWKPWMIQEALKALDMVKGNTLDEKAVESLPSMKHVREFTKAAKNLPKEKQRRLAKDITKKEIPTRQIGKEAREVKYKPEKKDNTKEIERKKAIKTFENFLHDTNHIARDLKNRLAEIEKLKEEFGSDLIIEGNELIRAQLASNLRYVYEKLTNLLNI